MQCVVGLSYLKNMTNVDNQEIVQHLFFNSSRAVLATNISIHFDLCKIL